MGTLLLESDSRYNDVITLDRGVGALDDDEAALEQHVRGGGAAPGHAVIRWQQDGLWALGARAGGRALGRGGGGGARDAELEH